MVEAAESTGAEVVASLACLAAMRSRAMACEGSKSRGGRENLGRVKSKRSKATGRSQVRLASVVVVIGEREREMAAVAGYCFQF